MARGERRAWVRILTSFWFCFLLLALIAVGQAVELSLRLHVGSNASLQPSYEARAPHLTPGSPPRAPAPPPGGSPASGPR